MTGQLRVSYHMPLQNPKNIRKTHEIFKKKLQNLSILPSYLVPLLYPSTFSFYILFLILFPIPHFIYHVLS
jgi:hypothetical protein